MSSPKVILARLRGLFKRDRLEHQMEDELRFHLEMQIEDDVRMGMDPEEARYTARRKFGGIESMKEEYRATRGFPWIDGVVQDCYYASRVMLRSPAVILTTVATLAIGIGANTAVFTAYKAMVARPLDAFAPYEMVNLALDRGLDAIHYSFSYPDYETLRDSAHSLSGVIAYHPARVTLSNSGVRTGIGKPESAAVFVVSENYFYVLGVKSIQGRTFESIGASELAAIPSVLISENYWQARYSGDPKILGKTVYLNGVAVNIAGITPHDFVGTNMAVPAFWLPASIEPLIHADDQWLRDREAERFRVYGRLAPGVSIGQAQSEVSLIAARISALHDPRSELAKPSVGLVWPGSPFPVPLRYFGGLILGIVLLMAAAVMVLVVACANVGSLQLARTRSRENELRTRMSLGASRLRIIRQLVTESMLVGLLAGAAALCITWMFLKASVVFASNILPAGYGGLVFDVSPDLGIFAFVLAVSLIAGLLSGVIPALESSRSAVSAGVRSGTSSVRSRRIQNLLVAVQVALSLILMIAGSTAIHSSINALTIDPGYDANRVVDVAFQFSETARYDDARKLALVRQLRTALAALPGVTGVTSAMPPGDGRLQTAASALGAEGDSAQGQLSLLHYAYVEPNYFEILGIRLIQGRDFESTHERDSSIVVSESAAALLWPGQSPVGKRIRLGAIDELFRNPTALLAAGATGPAYDVIGVVRDTRGAESDASDTERVYLPLPASRLQSYHLLAGTRSAAQAVVNAIDPTISAVDPNIIASVSTLEEMRRQAPVFVISSISSGVALTLGSLGLLLALIGIYGTVSYIVVLRTKEVGIRIAMGAQRSDVFRVILGESARPVLVGLMTGIVVAIGLSYLARGLLYGISGVDPISVACVSFLFLLVAVLATYGPARRAMRVDPMVALRYE
jgi:macrolide transport system ATP-binding/permease protein